LKLSHKILNLEYFQEKLEKLENEIKNSKSQNFFQQKLQDLKPAQTKKAQREVLEKFVPQSPLWLRAWVNPNKKNHFELCH